MNTRENEAMVGVIILPKKVNMLRRDIGLDTRIMDGTRRESMDIIDQQKAVARAGQGAEVQEEGLLVVAVQFPVEKWSNPRDQNQEVRMREVESWSTEKRRSHINVRKRLQA